jgi:carboxylate-amine ligase
VEVRVADVCLDVESAVLLAGLTRALVATALAEARRGTPVAAVPTRRVDASLAAAARHGIAGSGVDAFTGRTVAARDMLDQLVDHVYAALEDRGDTGVVTALLRVLEDRGTGAERQRALFAQAGSASEFVEALARATTSEASAPAPGEGR